MFQLLKEFAILSLTFGVGIFTFKHLNLFYRIILLQIALAVACFFIAHAITSQQALAEQVKNNHAMYNIYILAEGILVVMACLTQFHDKKMKLFVWLALLLISGCWLYNLVSYGLTHFANVVMVVDGIAISAFYMIIIYRVTQKNDFDWTRSHLLWVSLGMIVYFSCNVPYMGLFHYLNSHHPELSLTLFLFITDVLSNIRYLFIGIAFLLFYRNTTSTVTAKS
jgi:hypothetical protein